MSIKNKIMYGSRFYQKHKILWNILRFFWNWKDGVEFRYKMLVNNSLKDSLYYRLNHLFWNIFYPLGCLKDMLKRLFWRGVYKAEFFMEYLQYKFSKKEPEPPIDTELVKAIEAFYVSDKYKRAMIRQQLRDARKLLEKESQENINDK